MTICHFSSLKALILKKIIHKQHLKLISHNCGLTSSLYVSILTYSHQHQTETILKKVFWKYSGVISWSHLDGPGGGGEVGECVSKKV